MTDLTHDLPFWKGFSISSLDVQDEIVRVTLEPRVDAAMVCSGGGHNCAYVHEWRWRGMRDLPMLGRAVWLGPGTLFRMWAAHRASVLAGTTCPHH